MANGIHADVQPMQSTDMHRTLDRIWAEPEGQELPVGYHAVLPLRNPGDPQCRGRFDLRIARLKPTSAVMRWRLAAKRARRARGLCGRALDQWEKRLREISDRCPKTQGIPEPKLTSVP